jgi:hypothetical protein
MSDRFLKYIARLLLVLSLVTQSVAIAAPVCDMDMSVNDVNVSSTPKTTNMSSAMAHAGHDMISETDNQTSLQLTESMDHDECCDDCLCVEGHCSKTLLSNSGHLANEVPKIKQVVTTKSLTTTSVSSSLYRPPIIS